MATLPKPTTCLHIVNSMSNEDFVVLQSIVDDYTDGANVNEKFIRAASDKIVELEKLAKDIAEQLPAGAIAPKVETAAPVATQEAAPAPAPATAQEAAPATTQEAAPAAPAAPATETAPKTPAATGLPTGAVRRAPKAAPAAPAVVTTAAQKEMAERHAAAVGGVVAWQEGGLALIRGFSALSGQPVYSAAKGDQRTAGSVDSTTSSLITPDEKTKLVAIKDRLEQEAQAKHEAAPFITFNAQGVALSPSLQSDGRMGQLGKLAAELKQLLGIGANVYITTIEDAAANKDNLTGPHRAVGSAALNSRENGSMRRMADGSYYVAFRKGASLTQMLEVLTHELGHVHMFEVFDKASPEIQAELHAEHAKWQAGLKGSSARTVVESARPYQTARTESAAGSKPMSARDEAYFLSFKEWYADNVAKWAMSSAVPQTAVEKFFKKLGIALRKFYAAAKAKGYLPNESFKQYMDKLVAANKVQAAQAMEKYNLQSEAMFVGESTGDLGAFATAREMDDEGASRSRIWSATGWIKGVDGKWRHEISDKGASLKGAYKKQLAPFPAGIYQGRALVEAKLGDVLNHPELFALYPQLQDMLVINDPNKAGTFFDPDAKRIVIGSEYSDPKTPWDLVLKTLLHEVQHAVQDIEGLAVGGNAQAMNIADPKMVDRLVSDLAVGGLDRGVIDAKSISHAEQKAVLKRLPKYLAALKKLQLALDAAKVKQDAAFAAAEVLDDPARAAQLSEGQKFTLLDDSVEAAEEYEKLALENTTLADKYFTETEILYIQHRMYRLITGEIEAFDTEARHKLNETERRDKLPMTGEIQHRNQIVGTDVRGPDGRVRTTYARSIPTIARNVARLPPVMRSPVQRILDNVFGAAKRGLYGMAFTHDLADMVAKHIPSVRRYMDLMDEKAAIKANFQKRIDGVLDMVSRLSEVERGTGPLSVNAFLELTNRKGKWGYVPAHLPGLTPDPEVKAAFDRLSGSAQAVVKQVLQVGRDTLLQKQALVEQAINDEFAERIRDANASGDQKAINDAIAEQAAALTKYRKTLAIRGDVPYSPFKRYGNYVMVAQSQAYLDAVANEDQKWLDANQSDEAHNYVAFYETEGLAKEAERHFNARGGYAQVSAFAKEDEGGREYLMGGTDMAFAFVRLRNLVKRELPAQDKSTDRINRMLADLHISMLAETSARRNELERKFIAGHDKDMLRAFATQGRADAHFIAALSRNGEVDAALEQMRAEAKEPTSAEKGDRGDRMRAFNEFLRRHAANMDYKETPIQDAMARATSLMFLSTSPAYYLQNLTQTPMISLPYLAGKYGYGRTAAVLTQAYKDLAPMLNSVRLGEPMDLTKAPADVQRMIADMLANGRLDNATTHDLGDFESLAGDGIGGKVANVDRKMRNMQQKVEAINRVSTAIAAYRLAMQNSDIAPANRHAAAVAYAGRAVMHTHGDYSGFNSPRYFNPNSVPMAKVLFQFKKFQIIQLSLLARLLHNSFSGDEKTVARAQLRFILAHTMAMGGMMGLPGMATIGWLFSKMFGDDDEPENFEYKLRKLIGDKNMADLLISGVPASLGVNLSGKLGMGNVFAIAPFTNVDLTSRSGVEKTAMALTGPFVGGVLPKAADGVGKMMDGRYYEGLENLMPSGLANMMKGVRYATEGVTNSKGEVQLSADDISLGAAFGQALGLPTTTVTDFRFKQGVQINFEKQLSERSTKIQNAYNRAVKDGDSEGKREAIADFNKLQAARVANGFSRQPLNTLTSGPQDQRKNEKQTIGGLKYNNQDKGFVRQLSAM